MIYVVARVMDAKGLEIDRRKIQTIVISPLRQQLMARVTYYSGLLNLEYERKTGTPLIFILSYLALSRTKVESSTEKNSIKAKSRY